MPIYLYRCRQCKHDFEELQEMGASVPERCPKCEREDTLERLMGLSNFQLVGSGWAKDGYS